MKASSGIGELITLKSDDWFNKQKHAGQAVAKCLRMAYECVSKQEDGLTGKIIEERCLSILDQAECTPTFKGYKGFPGAVCLSVNKELVHGIPSDRPLNPGDLVSLDLGATYHGVIADAAMTAIYGGPAAAKDARHVDMLKCCEEVLHNAINQIEIGKHLGVIGRSIYKLSKDNGYDVICDYGGHGIDYDTPHASPFVPNKSLNEEGVHLCSGMTLAIEPMITLGGTKTTVLDDHWTVTTEKLGCHFEHTVFIRDTHVEIMTDWRHLVWI